MTEGNPETESHKSTDWDRLYDRLESLIDKHSDLDKRVVILETKQLVQTSFFSLVFGAIAAWLVNFLGIGR